MAKFKAGDVVRGNKKANGRYAVTKEGWIGEVLSNNDDGSIRAQGNDGRIFPDLDPECFDLVKRADGKSAEGKKSARQFEEGDLVRVTKNPPRHLAYSADGIMWIRQMEPCCGKCYRIREKVTDRFGKSAFYLNAAFPGLFSAEWLEPVSDGKAAVTPKPKRRIVIEITDDGADAKYIVGKQVERTAPIRRYCSDKPDDCIAAYHAVGKLFGREMRLSEEGDKVSEAVGWIEGSIQTLQKALETLKPLK
jgi:hypothetical protein